MSSRGVALVGFMGSGKSTVGSALATRIGLPFEDLDERIERAAACSVAQIFEVEGEVGFRAREAAELSTVLEEGPCVLATGGGAPIALGAMARLRAWGRVVFLDVPIETLRERVLGSQRPLWTGGAAALYRARRPTYRAAHLVVDGDAPVARVVTRIIEGLEA